MQGILNGGYNPQQELENRKRLIQLSQAGKMPAVNYQGPIEEQQPYYGINYAAQERQPVYNAPENAVVSSYNETGYASPENRASLGYGTSESSNASVWDLPEEKRPFTMKMDAKGNLIPQFNTSTKSGMVFALKAKGLDDDRIAGMFGVQGKEGLRTMMQEEINKLSQEKEPDYKKLMDEIKYKTAQKEYELLGKEKEKEGKTLPSSAIEGMAGIKGALEGVDKMMEEKKKINTGLLVGPAQKALDVVSMAPKAFTEMNQVKDKLLGDFQKAMSGLTVSDREAQRIEKLMPSIYDDDEKFMNKAITFKAELEKLRENQATLYSEGGYKVPGSFSENKTVMPTSTQLDQSQPTTMTTPDGKTYQLGQDGTYYQI